MPRSYSKPNATKCTRQSVPSAHHKGHVNPVSP